VGLMTSFQSILLIIFGIICYMMSVDENVKDLFNLIPKIIGTWFKKTLWIIQNDPRNPLVNLIKRWEYDRIAKELHKELNSKKD
jgi:hypothetical protein